MLDGLKRLLSGTSPAPAAAWDEVQTWAEARQCTFREVPKAGFVVEGRLGGSPWRLEWGPSQRSYIPGAELRIRAELGLHAELQVLLMNRELQEALEKTVFEQCIEGVETRIDNQTPPEMRWLVMYPKLSGADMPGLRERYTALASMKRWLLQWLNGPLTPALAMLGTPADVPLVLMVSRGRLMLRTALAEPQLAAVQAGLRLFETALREARRTLDEGAEVDAPSSGLSAWLPSDVSGEAPPETPAAALGAKAPSA